MFSKVILGFDGSEQARDALALAVALTARDSQPTVCCVHHLSRLRRRSIRGTPSGPCGS